MARSKCPVSMVVFFSDLASRYTSLRIRSEDFNKGMLSVEVILIGPDGLISDSISFLRSYKFAPNEMSTSIAIPSPSRRIPKKICSGAISTFPSLIASSLL